MRLPSKKASRGFQVVGGKLMEGLWTIGTGVTGAKIYDDHIKTQPGTETGLNFGLPSVEEVESKPVDFTGLGIAFLISAIWGLIILVAIKRLLAKRTPSHRRERGLKS